MVLVSVHLGHCVVVLVVVVVLVPMLGGFEDAYKSIVELMGSLLAGKGAPAMVQSE